MLATGAHVRRGRPQDAGAIANAHVLAWEETYGDLVPAAIVREFSQFDERHALWERRLANASATIFVVEDGAAIIGFASASAMPERPGGEEPIAGFGAYLDALYLLRSGQGRGLGRVVLHAIVTALLSEGWNDLAFHVLATNPARSFYQYFDAQHIRDEMIDPRIGTCICVYGWRDLRRLWVKLQP